MLKPSVVTSHTEDVSFLEGLARILSDTQIVTAKAQTYHWNVTVMAFKPLHDLFQEIHQDHFEAQDTLAERIKALDGHADGKLSQALKRSSIEECDGSVSAVKMVEGLAWDQKTLSSSLLELARIAENLGDAVTNDLAIERASAHDKFAWMLKTHLTA